MEVPQVPELSNSEKNKKFLSDKTNTSYGFENQSGYMAFEASGDFLGYRSCMLNEVNILKHLILDTLLFFS